MPLVVERGRPGCDPRRAKAVSRACAAVCLLCIGATSRAELELTGLGAWRLQPTASITQTFTTNVQASAGAGTGDSITDAGAGFVLSSGAGLVTGLVDYRLSALVYAREQSKSTLRHNLRAHVDTEWYERRGFLSMDAAIAQQAISAFGYQPTAGNTLASSNTTDTATLRVLPRWTGLLPGALRADLDGEYSATEVSNSVTGDNQRLTGGLHISPQTRGRLGWAADVQTQRSSYRAGRTTDTTTASGTLSYLVDPIDTLFTASGGRQRSNLMTFDQKGYAYWSVGANWAPSPRTTLRGRLDHQAFGRSHDLSFEHRTAMTSLRIANSRGLSNGSQSGVTVLGTLEGLYNDLLLKAIPDKDLRAAAVKDLINKSGQAANTPVVGGFLASSATIVDTQTVSMGLQLPRDTVTLTWSQSDSRRASQLVTVVDDLSTSNRILMRGLTATVLHSLTPMSSLSVSLIGQDTRGDTAAQARDQRGVSLLYSNRPTAALTVSLGLRHTRFETPTSSSTESAVFGTVAAKF